MEDWMGRIKPMPSKVKIAEPIVNVKEEGLKSATVELMPREERERMSYCQM